MSHPHHHRENSIPEGDEGVVARLIAENIALRCLLGAGCDANNDGPHFTIVKNASGEFCADCGEMTRRGKSKPWMDEDRLERTIARLAAQSLNKSPHHPDRLRREGR